MQESCNVLVRAKQEAKKMGLDSSKLDCPFVGICKRITCYVEKDLEDLKAERKMNSEKNEGDRKR